MNELSSWAQYEYIPIDQYATQAKRDFAHCQGVIQTFLLEKVV